MSETSNDCEACAAMERAGAPRELARAAHQADTVRAAPLPEADDEEMAERLCEAAALDAAEGMATNVCGHDGLVRPGTAVDTSDCPSNECQIRRMCTRPGAVGCRQVSDELRALAEAVVASQPCEQTPEEQRDWASRLAADVATADRSGAHILALAAEHDVITADELPEVLASIEEARNGPGSELDTCGECNGTVDARTGYTLPLTVHDAAEWRRLAGERADAIARLEGEVERSRDTLISYERILALTIAARNGHAAEAMCSHARYDALAEAIEAHLPEAPRLIDDSAPANLAERVAYAGEMISMAARQRDEFGAELDRIGTAVEAHLPPLEGNEFNVARIANAGAVLDATARDRDEWRRTCDASEVTVDAFEDALAIRCTDHDESLDERLWRVYTVVMVQRTEARKMERSRDLWRAKVKRLSEGARRGVVGSGSGTAASFAVGDVVTWSSSAGGGTKRKRGKVVEVVAPGKWPKTRSARGERYYGMRKHTWYVVDVDGEIYYPRTATLRRAKGKR
jgi:hypothetical protein